MLLGFFGLFLLSMRAWIWKAFPVLFQKEEGEEKKFLLCTRQSRRAKARKRESDSKRKGREENSEICVGGGGRRRRCKRQVALQKNSKNLFPQVQEGKQSAANGEKSRGFFFSPSFSSTTDQTRRRGWRMTGATSHTRPLRRPTELLSLLFQGVTKAERSPMIVA